MSGSKLRKALDLTKAWDADSDVDQVDLLKAHIRQLGLDRENVVLTGIDGVNVQAVLRQGIHDVKEKVIYAFSVDHLDGDAGEDPITYAMDHETGAVVAYDAAQLVSDGDEWAYEALPGKTFRDALLAVFRLKWPTDMP